MAPNFDSFSQNASEPSDDFQVRAGGRVSKLLGNRGSLLRIFLFILKEVSLRDKCFHFQLFVY